MEYNDKFQKISSAPLNKRNCYKQPRRKSGDLFKKQGDYSEKKMVPFTSSLAIKSAPLKGLGLRLGTIIRTIASPVTFTTFESARYAQQWYSKRSVARGSVIHCEAGATVTHAYPTTMRPSFQATIQPRGQPSASPKRIHAQCGYQKRNSGLPLDLLVYGTDKTKRLFFNGDDRFLRPWKLVRLVDRGNLLTCFFDS